MGRGCGWRRGGGVGVLGGGGGIGSVFGWVVRGERLVRGGGFLLGGGRMVAEEQAERGRRVALGYAGGG